MGVSQRTDKPLSEYSKDVNADKFFKDAVKMSKSEQIRHLKTRKAQHYYLAMYLKKEVHPFLPKNVSERSLNCFKSNPMIGRRQST